MTYVNLSDVASNRFKKRVGFSFYYFFLGPFYLFWKLRWEGILILIGYYYFLPLPGLNEFCAFLNANTNWDPGFLEVLTNVLTFFSSSWTSPSPYFGIILVTTIHIYLSFHYDNWLLRDKMKKKKWYPISQFDARNLIYYHVCKPEILLAKEAFDDEKFLQQAAELWEKKNLDFTMMFKKSELDKAKSKTENRRKLFQTNTHDITKPYKKKTFTDEMDLIKSQHEENLKLFKQKKISKEEYEILEDRLYKK